MNSAYDAIIVGARCAGSPTAMLLADFGPFTLSGSPGTKEAPVAYCARRTVLDKLLVDAAAEAGADIREGFTMEELLIEDRRIPVLAEEIRDRRSGKRRLAFRTI
jgi:flavin-dependent dehydrogenase